MTTFTITCPPTVAALTTLLSGAGTASSFFNFAAAGAIDDGTASDTFSSYQSLAIDSQSNIFFNFEGGATLADYGIPPGDDIGATIFVNGGNTQSARIEATSSWDGARTANETFLFSNTVQGEEPIVEERESQVVWTAEQTTSSQTTTTQTATVYQTTFTDTTNSTTHTGTLVQTGAMTAPEPSTTATQIQGFTTKTSELSTTRITTTTHQDTFNRWRTGEGGGTHRGAYQTATVVILETSNLGNIRPEIAWVVTDRPNFTQTSSAVVEEQAATQFTVLPSIITTEGRVEEGSFVEGEGIVYPVSIEVLETPTTYITTNILATQYIGAVPFNSIPSPLNEFAALTLTTEEWFSTQRETRYTGGDTSTTTVFTTTTHQGRIGEVTWNKTHIQSTTLITAFNVINVYTYSESDTATNTELLASGEYASSETSTATFERPISIVAQIYSPSETQNQCGSTLSWAVAAASNVTSAAQQIGAGGITVTFPPQVEVGRTARAPLGSWRYVTEETTVTASAGAASLSVTSAFGPSSAITTESTEAAWTLNGDALSVAFLGFQHRINLGGTPPTGTATAFYNAGIFSTTDSAGSGTTKVTAARTETINPNSPRTAYLEATGVFISEGGRYGTSARNIAAIIPETAIITDRFQLVL